MPTPQEIYDELFARYVQLDQRQLAQIAAMLNTGLTLSNTQKDAMQAEIEFLRANWQPKPTEPPPPPPPPLSRKMLTPKTGAYFGSSVYQQPGESRSSALARNDAEWGRKVDMPHWFLSGAAFPPDVVREVGEGRIPFLSMKIAGWTDVAQGNADASIRILASKIKALAGPAIGTYHHEPSNDLGKPGMPDASTYRQATDRCMDIFEEEGVDNFTWALVHIAYDFRTAAGAKHVNNFLVPRHEWVLADAYNWYPERPNSKWMDLEPICQHFLDWGRANPTRILGLGEWATNENDQPSPTKAAWMVSALDFFRRTPELKAQMYFNNRHQNPDGFWNDWRITTSPGAMNAARNLADNPHFTPTF